MAGGAVPRAPLARWASTDAADRPASAEAREHRESRDGGLCARKTFEEGALAETLPTIEIVPADGEFDYRAKYLAKARGPGDSAFRITSRPRTSIAKILPW